jgi:hypothetical protein
MRRPNGKLMAAVAATGWLATTGVLVAPRAEGATAPREQHCVVRVLGQAPNGELTTTEPECSTTRTGALRRSGADLTSAAMASSTLATHYDGYGYTGSSFTVVGDDCAGGWLNLPAPWNNMVSSTMHGLCPVIRHFDGFYLILPEQTTTWPGANLLTLNNRTSSVQYLQ